MSPIHTRWLALMGDGPTGNDFPPTAQVTQFSWGQMWTWRHREDHVEEPWTESLVQHRLIAAYEVRCRPFDTQKAIIGVASPLPVDTAEIIQEFRTKYKVREMVTTLDPKLVESSTEANISSVRYDESDHSSTMHFQRPVSPTALHRYSSISAMSVYLGDVSSQDPAESPLISLFDDAQFYVSECAPEFVGRAAQQISALWRQL